MAILLVGTAGDDAAAARPVASLAWVAAAPQPSDRIRTIEPGKPAVLAFPVRNSGTRTVEWDMRPSVPDGWRVLSGSARITLGPGEQRMHLVQLAVPLLAPATVHHVILHRIAATSTVRVGTDTVAVRVAAVRTVELTATALPSFSIAGDSFDAVFAVRNTGNVALRVALAATVAHGATIAPSWKDAELQAGQARTVTLRVATSAELPREVRHLVNLQARVSNADGRDTVAARASGSVLVTPGRSARVSRMHEIPAKLRFTSVGSQHGRPGGRTSAAAELSGAGPLRDGGRTRVEFAVRPPQAGAPGFQNRDEYRLKLTAPAFEVVLGDQQFALSPLTQQHRMASGARAVIRNGHFSIGGFVARDRHARIPSESRAAHAEYRIGQMGFLRAQVLDQAARDTGVVASLRARLAPLSLLALELEGGRNVADTTGAMAYSARVSGQNRHFSYGLWQQHADAAYVGDGARATAHSAYGSVRVTGPLRLRGAFHERTLAADSTWNRVRAGGTSRTIEGTASLGDMVTAGYHLLTRDATMEPGQDREERFARITAQARLGALTLQGTVDRGAVRNGIDTTMIPLLRAGAGVALRTRRGHAFAAQVHSATGDALSAADPRPRLSGKVSATVIPADRLSVRLQASGTRDPIGGSSPIAGVADATIRYAPWKDHEIAAQVRSASFAMSGMGNSTVRLTYSMPIGIPVGYSRTSGRVVGRVVDSETGRGMPNARVLLGDRLAITDANGNLEINGLAAGTQYLQLDLGASGPARVAVQPMPMPIESRAGGTSRVEIPVIRSVRISGRVLRLAPPSHSTWDGSREALADTAGMAGVEVTLTRDGETHRRVTGADGTFTAADLRPGPWSIAVDGTALPAHHYLEHPSVPVAIGPGQDADVEFVVLPRKRTLVMLDQAVIVADGGARPTETPPASMRAAAARRQPARQAATSRPKAPTAASGQRAAITTAPRQAVRPSYASRKQPYAGESYYITSEADRTLENVAIWIYGDATLWPKLWLANRQQLRDTRGIAPGTLLTIPPRGPLTREEIRARDELRDIGGDRP